MHDVVLKIAIAIKIELNNFLICIKLTNCKFVWQYIFYNAKVTSIIKFFPDMPTFVDGSKCSYGANYWRTIFYVDSRQCQRQSEQQRTRNFVHCRMNGHKLPPFGIDRDNIENLDAGDDARPDNEPNGNVDNRNKFNQADNDKSNIGGSVELRAKLACGVCAPCHSAVGNVGNASGDIQHKEH